MSSYNPCNASKLIAFFLHHILDFYRENKRDFPWRKPRVSPYEVWVSEVMLQQTQALRVVVYYERFLKRFPDMAALSSASWEEFLPYWDGLGYYRRGKNMLAAARMIASNFGGEFPRTIRDMEKLPGVGAYTARAIMSFAYDGKVLAWDTNFDRVFGRYFLGRRDKKWNFKKWEGSIQVASFADFNAAVMDFGSIVCMKNPQCDRCPLRKHCRYSLEDGKRECKMSSKTPAFPTREAQVFVILHEDRKKYFSSKREMFTPFILPPPRTSREDIKAFFADRYGLNVSVRPPAAKLFVDGRPTLLVYAQILSGHHRFHTFFLDAAKTFLDDLV